MKQTTIYITAILSVLLTGCSSRNGQSAESRAPLLVNTLIITYDSISERHQYSGEVRSSANIDLHHPLGGEVVSLHVKSGDVVRKGQLLAVIDSTRAHALHESAVAQLRQAEDAYQRVGGVHEKGVVADVKWVDIQTQLAQARQSERATLKTLTDCRITAPYDGTIASLNVHVGQHVLPGQSLLTLTDTHNMEIVFSVPEQDMPDIDAGEQIEVNVPAANYTSRANVMPKTVVSNPLTHTYLLRATLVHPSPQPGQSKSPRLLPGMLGTVRLYDTTQPLLSINGECVHTTTDGPAVWIVQDGKAHRQNISTGGFSSKGVIVTGGLTEGDTLITQGYQKLYEGAEVAVRSETATQ
ncbi:MAG: efflux RND transporter periplasmic adaptor subunit [Paludibacteraceae bacterium]|nr:efflux RND transporter periplasmic adaptor subunit [Paludibacteraceae bacterium]